MGKKTRSRKAKVRRTKRKTKQANNYSVYIHRTLKTCHPGLNISKHAMEIMNNFVNDMFQRISSEASVLAKSNKRLTLKIKDVEAAVKLIMPGEVRGGALYFGLKAVTLVKTSKAKDRSQK